MRNVIRLLFVVCLAVVAAGAGGLIADHTSAPGPAGGRLRVTAPAPSHVPGSPPTTVSPPATATTLAPVTVPTAMNLEANLLVPNDLGGYYHPTPAESAPQLARSGCLAPLGHPAGTARQAVQFLEGPYFGGLPLINEQLDAFSSVDAASSAYRSLAASIGACTAPAVAVYTSSVRVALTPLTIPGLGDQDNAVHGTYRLHGRTEELTVAVVRTGSTIVVFAYADTMPVSNTILGDVSSTIRAAVGKAS
ncbi:MAG: hypothetical protein M3137_18590 [Actinomycetota bacterium]|nr:hypothetical protein [Actinomycetota bacterium]